MTKYYLIGLLISIVPAMADVVNVSPDKLEFGITVLTTTAMKTAVVANPTKKTLNISSITADGDFLVLANPIFLPGPFPPPSDPNCGIVLSPDQQCAAFIVFAPSGVGLRVGTLTIVDDSPGSPHKIRLSGTGVPVQLVSITVTPANPGVPLGLTEQFSATGNFNNGTQQDLTNSAIWTSSAPGIASMNASGLAGSVGQGATTITAASGTVSGSTGFTVTAPVVRSIFVAPGNASIAKGLTQQFTATGIFTDNSVHDLTGSVQWTVSQPDIAAINPSGIATGIGVGTATISAASGSVFSPVATLAVTLAIITLATINPSNASIGIGSIQQFIATAIYTDGATQDVTASVTWTSDNPAVVQINASGVASATLSLGSARVGATLPGGVAARANLEVAFYAAADMIATRFAHTATQLYDGRVLFAGGAIPSSATLLASSELYDPALHAFFAAGTMSTSRELHTATLLSNGKVLVAGGFGGPNTAELFDPASATFSVAANMISAHVDGAATMLYNGQVLITGGDSAAAELYDPATAAFTATASMAVARKGHTATLLNDGRVLVAGGSGTTLAELYDPVTGLFSRAGNITLERIYARAILLNGGRVLITGGQSGNNFTSSAEIYDPAHGTFTATTPMSTARAFHTSTLLNNGRVLVAGGLNAAATTADIFDPVAGSFSGIGNMVSRPSTGAHTQHTATRLRDGQVLLAGGSEPGTIGHSAGAELYKASVSIPTDLRSIAITPEAASIPIGTTQRFQATGTFADGSSQPLACVNWAVVDPSIGATIGDEPGNQGVAVGTGIGSASLGVFLGGQLQTLVSVAVR